MSRAAARPVTVGEGPPAGRRGMEGQRVTEDEVTEDDVIQRGSSRRRLDWVPRIPVLRSRPARTAVVLGVIGLAAGLAAGYAVGTWHAAGSAPARSQPATTPVSVLPRAGDGFPLGFYGSRCSRQVGDDLQLGVEVTNDSPALLTVLGVDAVLPLGGLKPVSWASGPCGELPGAAPPDQSLTTGNSGWFTVTFQVLVRCPAPLPVQFHFQFDLRTSEDSRAVLATVGAFPDLGQVPYSGCH
jgi:hypothetical protein